MAFAFSNLQVMKSGEESLTEEEVRISKRKTLEFMKDMDRGNGVTQSEFLLAILEHEGVIDRARNITPWIEVRRNNLYFTRQKSCY